MVIIIPYFNFTDSDTARRNHVVCVKRVAKYGYPVITAEAALHGKQYKLITRRSIANHTHLTFWVHSVLWHKEALINAAWKKAREDMPEEANSLLWIDSGCYLKESVVRLAEHDLKFNPVLQCYSSVVSLAPDGKTPERGGWNGKQINSIVYNAKALRKPQMRGTPGGAWAATADFMDEINGLYPHMIVGGGDQVLADGVIGTDRTTQVIKGAVLRDDVNNWVMNAQARKCFTYNYLNGRLYHMWHTTRKHRRHKDRHALLMGYDPAVHTEMTEQGMIEWTDAAPDSLVRGVKNYILGRDPEKGKK